MVKRIICFLKWWSSCKLFFINEYTFFPWYYLIMFFFFEVHARRLQALKALTYASTSPEIMQKLFEIVFGILDKVCSYKLLFTILDFIVMYCSCLSSLYRDLIDCETCFLPLMLLIRLLIHQTSVRKAYLGQKVVIKR